MKKDPAEALWTLSPDREFSLEQDGFIGHLYRPTRDEYPGKALILFGGSDGRYPMTRLVAERYIRRGLTVLTLAYWNLPGLPSRFEKIPIETIEKPALWLKANGYDKVGLWGISMGAQLALIAGSLLPGLISCVVAVSPINIAGQGIDKRRMKLLPCSSWSFRGKELPYAKLRMQWGRILRDCIRRRSISVRSCYEDVVTCAQENAVIKVERITGPVLFLSAGDDDMWPAQEAGDAMMTRLERNGFPWPHEHICYGCASHLLVPCRLREARIFAIERRYPKECMESNMDSLERTLAFLQTKW